MISLQLGMIRLIMRTGQQPTAMFLLTFSKLTWFEKVLLGVVVVVFMFIGVLAASAIFDFDLPFNFLKGYSSGLTTEPPYAGVFPL